MNLPMNDADLEQANQALDVALSGHTLAQHQLHLIQRLRETYPEQRDGHLAALSGLAIASLALSSLARRVHWADGQWKGPTPAAQFAHDAVWAARRRYLADTAAPAFGGTHGPAFDTLAEVAKEVAALRENPLDFALILELVSRCASSIQGKRGDRPSSEARRGLVRIAAVAIRLLEEPRS